MIMEKGRVGGQSMIYIILIILLGMMLPVKIEGSFVKLTYVTTGVSKGAVCLDGSPPAYQLDKGFGEGANNWLVHIQGGGWCDTVESCQLRVSTPLGSSNLMIPNNFTGILSNNRTFNPNFYNWNRVLIRYCDGASFTGDAQYVDPVLKLYFRGGRIFDLIIDVLLAQGLKNASKALLSGCSAGGLASILHCDKFRAIMPTTIHTLKCLSDAGFFIHTKDASGGYRFEENYRRVVNLHGSAKNLPLSCTTKMEPSLCFYPQYVAPEIKTPLFLVNSAYDLYQVSTILAAGLTDPSGPWVECQFQIENCTANQIKSLLGFRSKFISTVLTGLPNRSSSGMYITTCHTHCQTQYQHKWLGDSSARLHNKSVSEAVGDWFYERNGIVEEIDEKHGLPSWCVIDPIEPNPTNNYTWPPGTLM